MKEQEQRLTIHYEHEMLVNPYPGILVALEGLDGSGSSTQAKNMEKFYGMQHGLDVWLTKEPTEGPIGATIRHILSRDLQMDNETLQMMFATDRLDHLNEPRGIIARLENKSLVITDRYLWSTIAYGHVENIDINWLIAMQSRFPLPDITVFLDASVDTCLARIKGSRMGLDLFEKKAKLEKVLAGYKETIVRFPDQFIVIDGEQTPDVISQQIKEEVEKHPKFSSLSTMNDNVSLNG